MRELKFRAWCKYNQEFVNPQAYCNLYNSAGIAMIAEVTPNNGVSTMQYTGLKDKNGDKEVYECDIIDTEGNIIGNQYETPTLLERKTNLLIQGFGTKDWLATYSQAVERGCHDA